MRRNTLLSAARQAGMGNVALVPEPIAAAVEPSAGDGGPRAARMLREDVTSAKEALSAHPQTEVALPAPFEDVLVTRAELESTGAVGTVRRIPHVRWRYLHVDL